MMNREILYNKNLTINERLFCILIESYGCKIELERIAFLMGLGKSIISRMIDELGLKGIIEKYTTEKNSNYILIEFAVNVITLNHDETIKEVIITNQRKPIPPKSIEEVKEFFFQQKKPPEAAMDFWNYYEAVGWYAGNQPITNWRAKALSWNNKQFIQDRPIQNPPPDESTSKKQSDFWKRKW